MRSRRIIATANVEQLLYQNDTRTTFWIANTDAVNALALQFGPSPGDVADFWSVPAGQVFVLDPANPLFAKSMQSDVWIVSPSGNVLNGTMFEG